MTTCQICGRPIKASSGRIAHHGYRRPRRGSGWQTSSCFGARAEPYEVACDRIPLAIERVETYRADLETSIERHLAEPPATLRVNVGYKNAPEWREVARTEGFTSKTPNDYRFHSYASTYQDLLYKWRREVEGAGLDLEFLRARLAAWVSPGSRPVAKSA